MKHCHREGKEEVGSTEGRKEEGGVKRRKDGVQGNIQTRGLLSINTEIKK